MENVYIPLGQVASQNKFPSNLILCLATRGPKPKILLRAKVVMFGIKLKLMKYMFKLTYFYDLLTYLRTIRAKVMR
jgi:hypothetical protein